MSLKSHMGLVPNLRWRPRVKTARFAHRHGWEFCHSFVTSFVTVLSLVLSQFCHKANPAAIRLASKANHRKVR